MAIYWHLNDGYGNASKITDMRSIWDKNGFFYFFTINSFMMQMQPMVLTFPPERDVFLKEANMKMYDTLTYFLGKTMPEIPLLIFFPFVTTLMLYWSLNLNNISASKYWEFYLISFI